MATDGRSSSSFRAEIPMSEMQMILDRLTRIESVVVSLASHQTRRDYYSTDEVAAILGKDPFTVREWARHGRIHAQKRQSGRGKHRSWVISHDELVRIQREGLLPLQNRFSYRVDRHRS
jgi:hypothetical protein